MVYFWDLFPVNRRPEHFAGSIPINAGAGSSDGSRVFVATQDKLIKELDFSSHDTSKLTAKGSAMANAAAVMGSSAVGLEGAVGVTHTVETMGYHCSVMLYDEARRLLILGTSTEDVPGAIITTSAAGQLGQSLEVNALHSGVITAMCLSRDGNMIISGDSNGCICLSEFETAGFSKATAKEGLVSFEFVDEVLIHRADLEARKGQIHALTMKVEELNQNNDHQLRLKDIEHNDNKSEIEDRYNFMLEAERVKFEELDREKQSIEVAFAHKVKALEKQQADELKAIEFKYKTKQNAEENRHRILQEETEGT
jgi:WD40 repeat protein